MNIADKLRVLADDIEECDEDISAVAIIISGDLMWQLLSERTEIPDADVAANLAYAVHHIMETTGGENPGRVQ